MPMTLDRWLSLPICSSLEHLSEVGRTWGSSDPVDASACVPSLSPDPPAAVWRIGVLTVSLSTAPCGASFAIETGEIVIPIRERR